jgi:TatD DNase family protein
VTLIDTHCHLDYDKFDADRSDVLLRARQAGVERILVPATSLESCRSVVDLAESEPMLCAAVGVHPTEARGWKEADRPEETLRRLARSHSRVVAVGEIGLDYYWERDPHDLQQEVLRRQLDLAAELGLPVILHFREKGDAPDGPCAADLLGILGAWTAGLKSHGNPLADRPGVLHSFSGNLATGRQAIELGFLLGVTGPVTYRKERQEVIGALPLASLLVETDAPFLSPQPWRGKRNEPAYVRLIADKIALLHQDPPAQVAAVTTENAKRLFHW